MKINKSLLGILVLFIISIGCKKDDDSLIYLSDAKQIIAFKILKTENPSLTQNIIATIDHDSKTISALVPKGTNLNGLIPNIQVSSKASINSSVSEDFSQPVIYTVTAEDKSTLIYTVTLMVMKGTEKKILEFKFSAEDNPELTTDVNGTIDETSKHIEIIVPSGTDTSDMLPTITISMGAAIASEDNKYFSEPFMYVVTAEDETTTTYEVTVLVAPSSENKISYFNFVTADNPTLTTSIVCTIDEDLKLITATFPNDANLSAMTPSIGLSPGATIDPNEVHDFTEIVTYTVTAEDGSSIAYKVELTNTITKEKAVLADIINKNPGNTLGWDLNTSDLGALEGIFVNETGQIIWLDISSQGISEVPTSIAELENIRTINLSDNNISFLPEEIAELPILNYLYVQNNNLSELPAALYTITSLTSINLNGNHLTTISSEIGSLTNLSQISISDNNLQSIPVEIGQLTKLNYFNFSSNEITAIPQEIGQLTNLQYLYVGDNQLLNLPASIWNITSIEYLSINNNSFSTLPNELKQLTNLIELNISNNNITALPAFMGELINLEYLNLTSNSFTSIPQAVCDLEPNHGTIIYKDAEVSCD